MHLIFTSAPEEVWKVHEDMVSTTQYGLNMARETEITHGKWLQTTTERTTKHKKYLIFYAITVLERKRMKYNGILRAFWKIEYCERKIKMELLLLRALS